MANARKFQFTPIEAGLLAALIAIAIVTAYQQFLAEPVITVRSTFSGPYQTAGDAVKHALRDYGESGQPARAVWKGVDGALWVIEIRPLEEDHQ